MLVLYLFVTGVAAFYCCLGLWAAVSPRHWFLRASIVLAMLALLVPIRAYEPLILFGLTTVILVAGVRILRWRLRRKHHAAAQSALSTTPSHYRFSLADLLLLLAVTAVTSWLVSVLISAGIEISWWLYLVAASMFALLTASAAGTVLYPPRWKTLLLLFIILPGAVAMDGFVLGNWLYADDMLHVWRDPRSAQNRGLVALS